MRTLTDHKLNGLNEALQISVMDEPDKTGGACHKYEIDLVGTPGESRGPGQDIPIKAERTKWLIDFQNGPIKEAGYNGLSNEALIAIAIDRCRSFQAGPFSCRENSIALTHLEEALMWLQKRTRDRLARGVEGTYQK